MLPERVEETLRAAISHHLAGRLAEAEALYGQVLERQPDHAVALHLAGVAAAQSRRPGRAVELISRAIAIMPTRAEFHCNLGNAYKDLGTYDQAIGAYRHAIGLDPGLVEALYNLGLALRAVSQVDAAIKSYREAIWLRRNYFAAHNNLGNALASQGQLDEAVASYQQALRIKPDSAETYNNLGTALGAQGLHDEAMACYRRALVISPDYAQTHSNLIYTMHLHPGIDERSLAEELERWNRQHALPLKNIIPRHDNAADPQRRLRVGYISADMCRHSVGRFLLPLFGAHDHKAFEIYAYADVAAPDFITTQLAAKVDQWRNIAHMTDEEVAQAVQDDGIDVLVDLAMHTAGNRLRVFARKPAPVQVTYLAYCSTTGLEAIDYRLSDPHLDPPGEDPPYYREATMRLPETYWCYHPTIEAPAVNELPAQRAGLITFGCLNNFSKITSGALEAWGRILQAVPGSRLIMHAHPGKHRQRVLDALSRFGVGAERSAFEGYLPMDDYFRVYQRIDLALDCFPYSGGTTTCDALWMGVPVITMRGERAVGRGGASILTNVGLPELIARNVQEYVGKAVGWASDLARLRELRGGMRRRMEHSPLMDGPRFARNIESAYRGMWRNWCEKVTRK